jgi:methyl-accepting chemotaxis protein
MSISQRTALGAGLILAVIAICAGLAAQAMQKVRLGGPMHAEVQQASDLIADILPPPAYIIESYLEATKLVAPGADVASHAGRLAQLRRDYQDRHAYWTSAKLHPELRKALLETADQPARAFFKELETVTLPAVRRGDSAAAEASYKQLSVAYANHRSAIDRSVALAKAYQERTIAAAGNEVLMSNMKLAMAGVLVLGLVAAAVYYLRRTVIAPLGHISGVTNQLAAGQDATVPCLGRADELGELAKAIEVFRAASTDRAARDARAGAERQQLFDALQHVLEKLAAGDLRAQVTAELAPDYAPIAADLNGAIARLRSMVAEVATTADSIAAGAGQVASASDDLSRRTEVNSANLQHVAAAISEINARLDTSGSASQRTLASADGAIGTVEGGRTRALEAVQAITRAADSASAVNSVLEGLDKIAFQTRVLAMNAAVEAGAAGDAGRGFSVVADLVSALAARAEAEAQRAHEQIEATQTDVQVALGAVQGVDSSFSEIVTDVEMVRAQIAQLTGDQRAQADALSSAAAALRELDAQTQQAALKVRETASAAQSMGDEVARLGEQAAAFRYEQDGEVRRSHGVRYLAAVA